MKLQALIIRVMKAGKAFVTLRCVEHGNWLQIRDGLNLETGNMLANGLLCLGISREKVDHEWVILSNKENQREQGDSCSYILIDTSGA